MPQYRGISGLGNINSLSDYNKIKSHLVFWRFRFDANDINTSAGVYDYSPIEDNVTIVTADDFPFGFQISISPTTITPTFWTLPPYNVPVCTGAKQTYPYYLNATFISLKQAMLDAVRARIKNTWSTDWKSKFTYWYEVSGKTGDEGTGLETVTQVTINGVVQPNPSSFAITAAQWSNYKRTSVWTQFQTALATDLPLTLLAINPSNDATDWAYSLANLANVLLKVGQVSHDYNNIGELFYAERMNALTAIVPYNMTFAEFENLDETAWFQSAPKQNMFAQICSFMAHGGTQLNIAASTFNNVIDINTPSDFWMFDFANEVMGVRDPTETNIGWIVFRDIIDGSDLSRFPENEYGAVVAASQYKAYNRKYLIIFNSSDTQEVKNDRYASLLLQYFNDARRVAIAPDFPQLSLQVLDGSNDHDAYNQDFIIYGLTGGNYSAFMTQHDPPNTSTGYARVGATTQPHGRFCRIPNPEILVAVDSRLVTQASYNVTFDIWYYNEGSRSWSLYYFDGTSKVIAETITNTGTNAWVQKTITVANFVGGGNLSNSTDWSLRTESGSGTKFELVKFTVNSQNTTILPISGKVSNAQLDICGLLAQPYYTYGVFAIGKVVYSDVLATVPITQLFFADVNTGTLYNVDTATGTILSITGTACGSGTQGVYILSNTLAGICNGTSQLLYTSGSFGVGKILYYNSNVFNEVTGFLYVVNTANSTIYNVDSATGQVLSSTGTVCNAGVPGQFRTGSNVNTICGLTEGTKYTDGQFTTGKILYNDISLTIPATGFTFVVTHNDLIYSVNSGTGAVVALVGECGGGVGYSFRTSAAQDDICVQSTTTLYVDDQVIIGTIVYQDTNLITPYTATEFIELDATNTIYQIDTGTGEILGIVGYCNSGMGKSLILGNFVVSICGGSPQTIYSDIAFGVGATLYYDVNLTDPVINFDYVLDPATGIVYDLNFHTSIVYDITDIVCNGGISGQYKLGNDKSIICDGIATTLYTRGTFGIGKTLYEDDDTTTILSTPYAYIVDVTTGYIYTLYNSVVIALSSGVCGGGTVSADYLVSNSVTGVCFSTTSFTLYTSTAFAVGVFLYTDVNLLVPFTGYTYILNPANNFIYIVNPSTGQIVSQTNYACTADLYIPNIDAFEVEVAKYIKNFNCGCCE